MELAAFLALLAMAGAALGKRRFVEAVLLTRSISDPLFDLTKSSLGRADIGLGAGLNVAMIAVACILVVTRPKIGTARAASVWVPFLLALLIAIPGAPERMAAVRFFLVLVSHAAMFLIPFYLVRTQADLQRYFGIIVAASLIPALTAFVQMALGHGMTDEGLRVAGTFSHPNVFAFYLLVILTLSLYMLAAREFRLSARMRVALTVYVPVLLALLVLTKTRSAWAGAAIIMGVYALRHDRRYLLYVLAAPALALMIPSVAERFADLQQGNYADGYAKLNSLAWRELLWHSALIWIRERPFFGYGLESFAFYVAEFFPMPLEMGTIDAHNVYIHILFEAGMVGLAAFIWMYVRLAWLLRGLLNKGYAEAWLLAAMIAAYLVMAATDNMLYYLTPSWYLWFALGGACALARRLPARATGTSALPNSGQAPLPAFEPLRP